MSAPSSPAPSSRAAGPPEASSATAASTVPILALEGLTKRFPGVVALDGIDLVLDRGEVHALAGENGAGKSSLIKLLAGIYRPDGGAMRLDGAPYAPQTPLDAIRAGIRVVHQEFNLLPSLTVAENLLFERLPRGRFGFVDRRDLERRALALLAEVGLEDVSPRARVETLGVAQHQLLEIAKALSGRSRILVLDEPTATLTPRESGRLFEIVGRLKGQGVTLIYVSHHLGELFALCDRVTVLRNGRKVETRPIAETSPDALVRMMVGRSLLQGYPARAAPAEALPVDVPRVEALRVEDLRVRTAPAGAPGLTFGVRYGEILGLAGLVGAGRTETVRAIFGADARAGGRILREGREVAIRTPRQAVAAGLCLLTENRKDEGLVLPMSARVNATLADIAQVSRRGALRPDLERVAVERLRGDLDIRLASIDQTVRDLSGGNQQKVVLAKWLLRRDARVLILDEPTRGIDVGAKAEIYALLARLADEGRALIIVSSELPELMGLCDRILVLSRGAIAGEVARPDFDEERILHLAYSAYLGADGAPSPSGATP